MFKDKTVLIGFIVLIIAIIIMAAVKFFVMDKSPVVLPVINEVSISSGEEETEVMRQKQRPYEDGLGERDIENIYGGKPKVGSELLKGMEY